jgi:hypothetical protein
LKKAWGSPCRFARMAARQARPAAVRAAPRAAW